MIEPLALCQARDRRFEDDRRDVRVGQRIGRREFCERIELRRGVLDVDQVERLAEVDDERILALADEHAAGAVAAGNADRCDVLVRVRDVVRNRLRADVVDRLVEHRRTVAGIRDGLLVVAVPRTAADVDGEGFVDVQRGRIRDADVGGAVLRQRNRHHLAADGNLVVGKRVLKLERERKIGGGAAVVADIDLVERVGVELEIVRPAVRILQRQVVGDDRHVPVSSGLVAAEHVEVGRVDLRLRRDERRLAVARCSRGRGPACGDGGGDDRGQNGLAECGVAADTGHDGLLGTVNV
jgi:hypothetical protein